MDFAAISNMLLEIFYIIIGIMMLNTAVLTLRDKNHKAKIGTAIFWALLGIIFVFGPYIPSVVVGAILVVIAGLVFSVHVSFCPNNTFSDQCIYEPTSKRHRLFTII